MDANSYVVTQRKRVVAVPLIMTTDLDGKEPIKNLYDALYLLEQHAKAQGVNTSYDNWAHYCADDDHLYIYFEATPAISDLGRACIEENV